MILEAIAAALVPVGVESIKQLVTRFVGGVKPASIDEQIKLNDSEVGKLNALAALDAPSGVPSQWVVDLRASSRYIGALAVIAIGITSIYLPVDDYTKGIALEAANIAFGFLFGSRIMANLKK